MSNPPTWADYGYSPKQMKKPTSVKLKKHNNYGRCPTCHQPIIAAEEIEEKFSPGETVIFRFIRARGKRGATGKDIWHELYGTRRDGGPLSPNIVAVQVKTLKKKLEGSEVSIITKGLGPHSKYFYQRKEN